MTAEASERAFELWAPTYDSSPNPLTALERRVLPEWIGQVEGLRVVDVGCGTGYWMAWARERGAAVFGVDRCFAMLGARRGGVPQGRLVVGDAMRLPFPDDWADLAICSLTFSYLPDQESALEEMLRVAQRAVISDMHPGTGWKRSFRLEGEAVELAHRPWAAEALRIDSGICEWIRTARFGMPEKAMFEAAGKGHTFEAAAGVEALQVSSWVKH